MSPLTPKQLEIRQRENRILSTASDMIRRGGHADLSMDAIAKQMRYTRGTIYNHFPNKEEIVLSLAARAVQHRVDLFKYAANRATKTRDQIAAIGLACEVYADHLPDDFRVEQIVRHDSVWQKTSAGRQALLHDCEAQCMSVICEIIESAVACGDLTLPRGRKAPDIVYGLWSLVYGGLTIESTSPSLSEAGISQPRLAIRRNCNALLDGLGWTDLYEARKYSRLVARIEPQLVLYAKLKRDGSES